MPRKKRKYEEHITIGFRDDGRRIRKYIGADSKAEFERLKFEAKKEAELVRNPSSVTFQRYAEEWIQTYKAIKEPATQRNYKIAFNNCKPIHKLPLSSITASQLQRIINKNIDHPETCAKTKRFLKQIYAQAIADGILPPFNLADNITLPKQKKTEKRIISDAEMEIIDSIDFNDADRLFIDILRNTGMRPSEVLALQWSDIGKDTITVRRSLAWNLDGSPYIKSTKTGVVRTIPIPSDLFSDVRKQGIFVFLHNEHPFNKLDYNALYRRIMYNINRALGGTKELNVLNGLNLYSFRHTYATQLYYKAVQPGYISMKKAASIMGHSEKLFMSTYTHIDDKFEDEDAVRNMFQKGDRRETGTLKNAIGRP